MITAILCQSSNSYLNVNPVHAVVADNQVTIGVSSDILDRTLQDSNSEQSDSAVYYINRVAPNQLDGNFNILGSLCTSIVDATDDTDLQAIADSNSILIFDGCIPCNTCTTIAWLQTQLQRCQLILTGLKDCQLYDQQKAQALWQHMSAGRQQLKLPESCKLQDNIISVDRKAAYGQAVKLLYQYKAVVAMWNYMVRCKSWTVKIQPAPQDYAGFVVQTKRTIDTCGVSGYRPYVDIHIQLQDGQTKQFLENGGYGMGVYADKIAQNTYIAINHDPSSVQGDSSQVSVTVSKVQLDQLTGHVVIDVHVAFAPTTAAYIVVSAAIKVLPSLYRPGGQIKVINDAGEEDTYTAPEGLFTQFSLQDWVKYRIAATTITQALQTERNIWKVDVSWSGLQDTSDSNGRFDTHRYYTTAYAKYPGLQASDSSVQEEE